MLYQLNHMIPHKNWFVAGGSVASLITTDVHVYFYSKEDYDKAIQKITKGYHKSTFSATFIYNNIQYHYVKSIFGQPRDIFKTINLNKSCIAMLPTEETIRSDDYNELMYIKNINSKTLIDFIAHVKYHRFNYNKIKLIKVIEDLISKDTVDFLPNYDPDYSTATISVKDYLSPLIPRCADEVCKAYDIFPESKKLYRALKTFPNLLGPYIDFENPKTPELLKLMTYRTFKHRLSIPKQFLDKYPDFFI